MRRPLASLLGSAATIAVLGGCGVESAPSGAAAPPSASSSASAPRVILADLAPDVSRVERPGLPVAQEALALSFDHAILRRLRPTQPYLSAEAMDEVTAELTDRLASHGPVDGWIGQVYWTRPVRWNLQPMRLADLPLAPVWSPYRVEIEVPGVSDYAWGFEAYCILPAIEEWTDPGLPRRPIERGDRIRFRATPAPNARIQWHADDDRDRFVYGPVNLSFIERLDD